MTNPGDNVRVITKDEEFEGILMPNESKESVIIKLDSGYNIGIEEKKIEKIKKISEGKKIEISHAKKIKKNPKAFFS